MPWPEELRGLIPAEARLVQRLGWGTLDVTWERAPEWISQRRVVTESRGLAECVDVYGIPALQINVDLLLRGGRVPLGRYIVEGGERTLLYHYVLLPGNPGSWEAEILRNREIWWRDVRRLLRDVRLVRAGLDRGNRLSDREQAAAHAAILQVIAGNLRFI
jgi:hypothetical protein